MNLRMTSILRWKEYLKLKLSTIAIYLPYIPTKFIVA